MTAPTIATIGATQFALPLKTAAEWYATKRAKENRMNDYDRFLDQKADQAREEAEKYVRQFNEGEYVYNPHWDLAEIADDGPDDFEINVYSGSAEHVRLEHFTGANPLATFQKWVETRESEAIGMAA